MIHVVLDCTAALDWFMPSEPGIAYSEKFLAEITTQGVEQVRISVPLHFDVELAGVLLRTHRREPMRFTAQWLAEATELMDVLPIETVAHGANFDTLVRLAVRFNLTAYDTPYLALARTLGVPLVTRDSGLVTACSNFSVPRWMPSLSTT